LVDTNSVNPIFIYIKIGLFILKYIGGKVNFVMQIENVSKTIDRKGLKIDALKNVSVKIEKGEIYGIVGFSGAGKSTLISTINHLTAPTNGEVIVDGKHLSKASSKDIREIKKDIGMIFQHFNLLNSKTVFKNVAMPLILSGTPKEEIEHRVNELLDFVIKLVDNYNGLDSIEDAVVENKKNIQFKEVAPAQIPRTLDDVTAGAINNGIARDAGFDIQNDSIFLEDDTATPYVNIIAVRAEDKDNETLNKIAELYQEDDTKDLILETYDGALIPT